jgi:hypothetical protein
VNAVGGCISAITFVIALATVSSAQPPRAPQTGDIAGHITYSGRPPGNPIIRMGMDPKCADMNRGRQVIQAQAMVAADGSIADVFVRLEGNFPATPVPPAPVVIDQRSCVYEPRVVGMRVGQRLQVRNDDNLLHNVHSSSATNNSFNVAQPGAGMAYEFTPRTPEVMLKLGCDVHRWMVAFVGVMSHPYFAVSSATGQFRVAHVPAGSYTVKAWHEQFGERTQAVVVKPGGTAQVDFTYSASGRQVP